MLAAAVLLAAHGLATHDVALYAMRGPTGVASAATFIGGGLLAARLGSGSAAAPARAPPGRSGARHRRLGLVGACAGGAGRRGRLALGLGRAGSRQASREAAV